MSPAEVSARLRVSRRTVYRLIDSGALTATRIRRQWRVDPASLEAYITAQTSTAHERNQP